MAIATAAIFERTFLISLPQRWDYLRPGSRATNMECVGAFYLGTTSMGMSSVLQSAAKLRAGGNARLNRKVHRRVITGRVL
jgi:hypothetical protein